MTTNSAMNFLFVSVFAAVLVIPMHVIGNLEHCGKHVDCLPFSQRMLAMDPNEWGDLLAGVFSPLAFALAFIAIIIQASELREQRREIELNRKETEKMAAALSFELMRNREAEASQYSSQLVKSLSHVFDGFPDNQIVWEYTVPGYKALPVRRRRRVVLQDDGKNEVAPTRSHMLHLVIENEDTPVSILRQLFGELERFCESVGESIVNRELTRGPSKKSLDTLLVKLLEISSVQSKLSRSECLEYEAARIPESVSYLREILGNEKLFPHRSKE